MPCVCVCVYSFLTWGRQKPHLYRLVPVASWPNAIMGGRFSWINTVTARVCWLHPLFSQSLELTQAQMLETLRTLKNQIKCEYASK